MSQKHPSKASEVGPRGQLAIRTVAMPCHTNPNGDIFGGWVVSQMDLAGLSVAQKHAQCRVTTVAIDQMTFLHPVSVGDFICCYADIEQVGRTSVVINVQTWVIQQGSPTRKQVTEGVFTFVAIDQDGRPTPIRVDS